MPEQYLQRESVPPKGSIIDRATSVLEQERSTTSAATNGSVPMLDAGSAVGELERRVYALREQVQDLVDAFTRLGEQLPMSRPASPMPASPMPAAKATSALEDSGVPMLRLARAAAGEFARVALDLVNDSDSPTAVALRATNLVSEQGYEIPASAVSFGPNPVTLPGRAQLPVQADVLVPRATPPGTYAGLVQAAGLEAARAVLTVVVSPWVGR